MSHVRAVDLGFAEDCEPWQVESYLFPSKIGGKPAWLDLENLPKSEDSKCKICEKPLVFLLQIYAPYEEDPQNFHRTLYVFICRNRGCCRRNCADSIKIWRCSLPRENKFYSFEPVEDKLEDFVVDKWAKMCNLCGVLSSKCCSKCKKAAYCSREHQVLDWKEGHKTECELSNQTHEKPPSKLLFPEREIVIESEETQTTSSSEEIELEKFKQLELEGKTGTMSEVSESELDQHVALEEDKIFSKFKKRISTHPEQVLRYQRAGDPLFISETPKPLNIPNCEACGGERQFEFQVMPQILSVVNEHELDFGVLLIYTCKRSCSNDSEGYKTEFVFRQDVSENRAENAVE